MPRRGPVLSLLLLAGCSATPPAPTHDAASAAARYASMDYCADQMLLKLVDRRHIVAVSPEADSDVTFAAPLAKGIPRVRPQLEDIARLRPTVVLRSYGGGPNISDGMQRIGVDVVQMGFPDSLEAVRSDLMRIASELDAADKGQALVRRLDGQLAAANTPAKPSQSALYMTPGDVTTGPGSLVAELIGAAGYTPYRREPGWGTLPLEAMVQRPPDAVLTAFFDSPAYTQDYWTSSQHPVARRALASARHADVPGAWVACGNWMVGDAVTALAATQDAVPRRSTP